ncbi:hypothetical protein [Thalassospira lucentensis]|uniref:hypothetical protein n=1 Tax=Thalassospira lucentensis TaxID=168935 RepID=UPI0029425801|nr:hypothetical protein [Thalassospira lucentensis]WOI12787.1 hypothetical protein R1T41_09385 [Thalassospira lucentensis]
MTITIAWERKLSNYSELVFCSDSRLSGGGNIDVCQKVFPLPREDAAIGFCGSTLLAYPIINQFISYVRHYKKNLDRSLDGSELPNRFASLTNKFLKSYMNPIDLQSELKETSFLIGSFSWRLQRPIISNIRYDAGKGEYVASKSRFPKGRSRSLNRATQFGMIGDLRYHYFDHLKNTIEFQTAECLNMEPFSALCDMLQKPNFTDRYGTLKGVIGGAPQLLKIYPFLRTIEFGVHWPSKADGKLYLNGRELFEYEKVIIPQIDSTTHEMFYPLEGLGAAGNTSKIE